MALPDHLGGVPQRAGDVLNRLTGLQGNQFARAFTHGLDHKGDGAGSRVGVGDGQGNALRACAAAHDDKLARLPYLGNPGRAHVETGHIRTELGFGDDGVHPGGIRKHTKARSVGQINVQPQNRLSM
jgi:hypothetical protein